MPDDNPGAGSWPLMLGLIILLVLAGALLWGWISDSSATRAVAQAQIAAAAQQGATERAQTFALTLAGVVALGTSSGSLQLLTLALTGGLFYLIWRDGRGRGGGA